MLAGARSHVDNVVGGFDGFQIMFHNDDGVAKVAQVAQRIEQARVVTLMQTDGRLIEHVHDTGQTGADLRCQPYPLCFAAGKSLCRAIERQVVEADVDKESQARGDFLDDLFRDLRALSGKGQQVEEVAALDQRQVADFRQRFVADGDVAGFLAQTCSRAFRAGFGVEILGQFFAHHERIRLAVAPLEIRNNAFEGVAAIKARSLLVQVAEFDLFPPRTVKDDLLDVFRHLIKRDGRIEVVMRRQ